MTINLIAKVSLLLAFSAALSACSPASQNSPAMSGADAELEGRATGAVLWPGLPPEAHEYVNRRLDEIEGAPPLQGGVLFVGDSITDGAPLYAMFPNLKTSNHGIAWDTTDGVLLRLAQITRHSPDRLFMMIGTNDTDYTSEAAQISGNIFSITDALSAEMPETELYVVSVLPRGGPGNAVISEVNADLEAGALARPYQYLDLASAMRGPDGEMDPALSYDNLHLNVQGYAVWEKTLRDCVWNGCPNGLAEAAE